MGDILLLLMGVQAQILTDLDKLNKESFTKDDILNAMVSTTTNILKTLASKELEQPKEKSAEDLINEGLDKLNSSKK